MGAIVGVLIIPSFATASSASAAAHATSGSIASFDLAAHERGRILRLAGEALSVAPATVTSARNPRSAGGPHDFSSEGDYWWPDPKNPDGPYIQRDGMTNPDNFVAHRRLLMDFARHTGALLAAYDLTKETRYAEAAVRHLRAWFVDPATRMNPNLQYAQAIKGRSTGRGIGIIDTVHLAEVALGLDALAGCAALDAATETGVRGWFRDYVGWLRTHKYGEDESKAKNNHATCFWLQLAAFARASRQTEIVAACRKHLRDVLLPNQMAAGGSFPLEMARTKPYGYAIFNLDVMTALAVAVSTPAENEMRFTLPDGRGHIAGVAFLAPYLADKSTWPKKPDVMYWNDWPVRQPALLFGALAAGREDWLTLWKKLPADSEVEEVRRNFPIRFPTLWLRRS